ncbi:MAG: bifunctional demethylmenaquinone methyltransferase/2-methoxy-6-polyprenyl,4-benzoquinol methylase [Verrucomicrobiales bacterium]|nr:bifunctional demethylmenaquinone methyltransferase/2-methoxy-6-polyprenyl,4-benzoquinol methylase [Verrucomicrobiales bacterium]
MSNKYYQAGLKRAPAVEALFNKIAGRYDLINDLQSFGLHRLWKRKLVSLANLAPGVAALDLCCGTGDVAFSLAKAGAKVTAADFTRGMLDVAEHRSLALPPEYRPQFIQADALHLPFPDNSFDIVTISFGLRNLSDEFAGLAEIKRVLRSGGQALVLDFGKPNNPLLKKLYFFYLKRIVPVIGKIFCGDSDTHSYIYESLLRYQAQIGVQREMNRQGFQDARIHNLMGGMMSINTGKKSA